MINDYCKIGFTVAGPGGNRTGIGAHHQWRDGAGVPSVICSYGDAGAVLELAALRQLSGVPHVCIYRPNVYPENAEYELDPDAAAGELYARWKPALPPELLPFDFVWYIFGNEPRKEPEWVDWYGSVATEFARMANADGLRVLAFGYSAGTPEIDGWTTPGALEYLNYCAQNPGMAGIAVHEGANPATPQPPPYQPLVNNVPWITARYRHILDVCDNYDLLTPRIAITECAWHYRSAPRHPGGWGDIQAAAAEYALDPEVMAVCLWALSTTAPEYDPVDDDVQTYISPVAQYATGGGFSDPIWPDDVPHYMEADPAPANLITNGGFEEGWYNAGNIPELQIPNGWNFFYYTDANPIDDSPGAAFVRPEVRVLPAEQLPPDERGEFIKEGRYTLKCFKGSGSWYAGMSTTATLPAGRYEFTVPIFADLVKAYTPSGKVWADDPAENDGLADLIIDGEAGMLYRLTPGAWNILSTEFDHAGGDVSLEWRIMCPFPLANSGVFIDDITLYKTEEQPEMTAPEPNMPPVWYSFDPFGWALYKRAYADGWTPSSAEWNQNDANGNTWRYLQTKQPDGSVRTYYAKVGDWGNVDYHPK